VAVPAVETELADVELVAVGHRLLGLVADVGVPGGEKVPDPRDGEDRAYAARECGYDRKPIPGGRKDLAQWDSDALGDSHLTPRERDGTATPIPRLSTKDRGRRDESVD
jgi:hypothetical protein